MSRTRFAVYGAPFCLVVLLVLVGLVAGCGGGGGGGSTTVTVTGNVLDNQTLAGISGADVKIGTMTSVLTSSSGQFAVPGVGSGTQSVVITKSGYNALTRSVTVSSSSVYMGDIYLAPGTVSGKGHITGYVRNSGVGVGGAEVKAQGKTAYTKTDGSYTLYNLTPGSVTVSATLDELSGSVSTTVTSGATASANISVAIGPPPPPPI